MKGRYIMTGFVMALIKVLLCGGFVMLMFKLFNTLSFSLDDEWYYDFIKFVLVLSLPILFLFFCIFVVL